MGAELAVIPAGGDEWDSVYFRIRTDREKYTFSYAFSKNGEREEVFHEIGSGLNAGLSTEGTRTMTFTGTMFSLFSENGTGVFLERITLEINPDENYVL